MKKAPLCLLLLVFSPVWATKVPHRSLSSLVADSDLIVMVQIEAVTMTNQHGEVITDPRAMTGPGRGRTITLQGRILPDGVLQQKLAVNQEPLPAVLAVQLLPDWHLRLADVDDEEVGRIAIWLLHGDDRQPVYPGLFNRSAAELSAILELLKSPD